MSATLVTPKTTSGGEIIRELVNASDGAGLHFDGAAGSVSFTPVDLGTDFSLEFVIKQDSNTDAYIVDFSDGGSKRFIFGRNGDELQIYTSGAWDTFGVAPLDNGKVHHLVVTVDGTATTLYDNGNQIGTLTLNANEVDATTSAAIGSRYNSASAFFDGTIYRARFYNKALTSAEVQTAYERADVDFADQYGSQTSKILNGTAWTGASGSTPPNSWTAGITGVFTIDSSSGSGAEPALKITRSSNNPYIHQNFTAVIGKKYRVKYRVKNVDATNVIVGIGSSAVGEQYNQSTYTSTSWSDYESTITATTTVFSVYVQVSTTTGTQSGYVDSLTVEQVGCISDYDLAFANPTQSLMVQDRSGAADGTASASGVSQVQPVVQLNTEQLSVGGTNAKIGIGLAAGSSPQEMLHIDGISPRIRLRDSDASGTPISTIDASGGDILISADANDETAGSDIRLATDGTTHFTLDSSGQITQTGEGVSYTIKNSDTSLVADQLIGGVAFEKTDSSGAGTGVVGGMRMHSEGSVGESSYLAFSTADSSTNNVERVRITSDGSVGIGTPTPTVGNLQIRDASVSTFALTRTTGNTGASLGIIRFGNTDVDSNLANIVGYQDGATDSAAIAFQTQPTGGVTTTRLTIDSTGLATFSAGIVTSEKGIISGSVTVADDAVTTITPQRKGGFINILADTTAGDGGYPVKSDSAQIWFDCGSSLNIEKLDIGTVIGSQVETSTSNLTGTTGTDGRVTVSVQSDVIQIENRQNATRIFNYTIIC